jgi:hypothetical protein
MSKLGKIVSQFHPTTYITAHHGGSGETAWAYAEAYWQHSSDDPVVVDARNLEPAAACAKAIAMLRNRSLA